MVFFQKLPFFQLFFCRQLRIGKCLLRYSRTENCLSRLEKQKFQKVEKLTFLQRSKPMVLVEKCPFFQLFFLGNIGQENVFYHTLERKNAYLGYKNNKFTKSKNWHFLKVVNPWFWSKKRPFFQLLFLSNIGQENVFCDIVERKHAFQGYKKKKSKKSKNSHFFKRVNPWFCS